MAAGWGREPEPDGGGAGGWEAAGGMWAVVRPCKKREASGPAREMRARVVRWVWPASGGGGGTWDVVGGGEDGEADWQIVAEVEKGRRARQRPQAVRGRLTARIALYGPGGLMCIRKIRLRYIVMLR